MPKNKISDQIAAQLEAMIAEDGIQVGGRLPAERQLAERLGVSRPSLREAIQKLTNRGLLYTRHGGGTYLQDVSNTSVNDPLVDLFQENPEYRYDVLEIRHALDGSAAFYAALRATDEDKARIQESFDAMLALHGSNDLVAEANADADFHLAIVEASHNQMLVHVMRGLFNLLRNSISQSVKKLYINPNMFEPLYEQHKALLDAVLAGKAEEARSAAQYHLEFVGNSLKQIDEDDARHARNLRMLDIIGGSCP
jgi:DNA-binding FadR family transcriptional regulator